MRAGSTTAGAAQLGRVFYAVSILTFGLLHLAYGAFVTRVIPASAFAAPPASVWAYACGVVLIVAGALLLARVHAQRAAWLLAAFIGACFLALHLPAAWGDTAWGGRWTAAGKALALAGGALAAAGVFPARRSGGRRTGPLPWGLPAARLCLAVFLMLCGIQHFLWTRIVVGLVPGWVPWPLFWAYFTGVALVAGGAGLLLRRTLPLAAAASGVMILLWVPMVHIPRAVTDLRNSNEVTAVFEALAMSGIAFLLLASASREPSRDD